jgi:hypothetical protein
MNESDLCGCRKSLEADRTGHANSHLRLPQMIPPRKGGIDLCGGGEADRRPLRQPQMVHALAVLLEEH